MSEVKNGPQTDQVREPLSYEEIEARFMQMLMQMNGTPTTPGMHIDKQLEIIVGGIQEILYTLKSQNPGQRPLVLARTS